MPLALGLFALVVAAAGHALSASATRSAKDMWALGWSDKIPGFATRWDIPNSSPLYKLIYGRYGFAWSPVRVLGYGYTASDGGRYWQVQTPDGKKALALDSDLTPRPAAR
jgi:hypothetical protein